MTESVYARKIVGLLSAALRLPAGQWEGCYIHDDRICLERSQPGYLSTCSPPQEGLTHHSDRGSQYLSIKYTERLIEAGIDASVGSVGDSYDNALAESIIGLFKTEVINMLGPWKSVSQLEWQVLKWVHWYNTKRLHSKLNYQTPIEKENAYYQDLNQNSKAA